MYLNIAYSSAMRLISMSVSFINVYLLMYLIAKLIEDIYFTQFPVKRKLLFALLSGTVLNDAWRFGLSALSPLAKTLLSADNPVFALLFYLIGILVLNLPSRHAGRLMGHAFLYYIITSVFCRLVASLLFIQQPGPRNHLMDAVQQLTATAIMVMMSAITVRWLRLIGYSASLADQVPDKPRRGLLIYTLNATFVFVLCTWVPETTENQAVANALLMITFVLLFLFGVQLEIKDAIAVRLENKNVHSNALRNTIEEFSGIKRNFHSILQGYQRHLSKGDLEGLRQYHDALMDQTVRADGEMQLSRRMEENPALVALLINKAEAAKQKDLRLRLDIQTSLCGLAISNLDLCRVVACLLDNALEAAQESDQRLIHFSIEYKPAGGRLIILSNSTGHPVDVRDIERPGVSSKPGHMGQGLPSVRKTLAKYENCTLHTSYYDGGFFAYLAIG